LATQAFAKGMLGDESRQFRDEIVVVPERQALRFDREVVGGVQRRLPAREIP
jgi:hypothetical protein